MAGRRDPNLRGTVVVVGGVNSDGVGRSFAPPLARDSDPGWTSVGSGGIGRNVAENLVRTGVGVEPITALGGDHNALALSTASHQCNATDIGFWLTTAVAVWLVGLVLGAAGYDPDADTLTSGALWVIRPIMGWV